MYERFPPIASVQEQNIAVEKVSTKGNNSQKKKKTRGELSSERERCHVSMFVFVYLRVTRRQIRPASYFYYAFEEKRDRALNWKVEGLLRGCGIRPIYGFDFRVG
jgi:hypothetical protein